MYSDDIRMIKRGIRCTICTGCGRCPGVERMHVLTKRQSERAVDLRNPKNERLITVDLGTSTIAMQLHHIDGRVEDTYAAVNPQNAYGADIMSRIAAAAEVAAAKDMQRMVLDVLEKGIRRFEKKIAEGECLRMVLAANTTMVYLLQGWNTEQLGRAPFQAEHLRGFHTVIAGVRCYVFPGLSAFVGGDIVAGIHASRMLDTDKLTLLIDLGTNGEIVLGNNKKILASSTSAGPAFEGGVTKGVWGADMVRFLAIMKRRKLLDETGTIADRYFDSGVRIGDVWVTQQDVRTVQLAKAAVAAGVEILMDEYGCSGEDISRVILAGGFGYYLNPQDAADIGLLPEMLVTKTVTGGNTALTGALYIGERILGKCAKEILPTELGADIGMRDGLQINVINLAQESQFEYKYLNAMKF